MITSMGAMTEISVRAMMEMIASMVKKEKMIFLVEAEVTPSGVVQVTTLFMVARLVMAAMTRRIGFMVKMVKMKYTAGLETIMSMAVMMMISLMEDLATIVCTAALVTTLFTVALVQISYMEKQGMILLLEDLIMTYYMAVRVMTT